MITRYLSALDPLENIESIKTAAKIIASGGLCAIPTETVYGLGANAYDVAAIKSIYKAKGRPQDNPLIVHIADFSAIKDLVNEIPQTAHKLAEAFWPGALTIILPKSDRVSDLITCGLDTVAIRIPQNSIARSVIKYSGVPIAAPSANLSGKPSATTAQHVLNDLDGLIDAVLDGGHCDIGVESTVIDLSGADPPRILRPGAVTAKQVEEIIGKVIVDSATLNPTPHSQPVASPGMKHKHYAPLAHLTLVEGESQKFIDYANQKGIFTIAFEQECKQLNVPNISLGANDDVKAHAYNLYNIFRNLDADNIDKAIVHYNIKDGLHMAVYNRLLRAANFEKVIL